MQSTRTPHEQAAYDLGVEHAKNAASWIVDGNTKTEFIPAVLEMFDAGDPAVYDYLPRMPDLSGEYADDLTPSTLAVMVGLDPEAFGSPDDQSIEIDAACEAYEVGVSETFEPECERILREAIA